MDSRVEIRLPAENLGTWRGGRWTDCAKGCACLGRRPVERIACSKYIVFLSHGHRVQLPYISAVSDPPSPYPTGSLGEGFLLYVYPVQGLPSFLIKSQMLCCAMPALILELSDLTCEMNRRHQDKRPELAIWAAQVNDSKCGWDWTSVALVWVPHHGFFWDFDRWADQNGYHFFF